MTPKSNSSFLKDINDSAPNGRSDLSICDVCGLLHLSVIYSLWRHDNTIQMVQLIPDQSERCMNFIDNVPFWRGKVPEHDMDWTAPDTKVTAQYPLVAMNRNSVWAGKTLFRRVYQSYHEGEIDEQ